MEQMECRDTSLKELPTRESKLKRNKDRRDSPTVPPVRLRLKSNSSPLHEPEMERSYSDRSVSSSPDFSTQNISPTMAYYCYSKHNLRVDCAPSSPVLSTELNSSVLCEVPFSSHLNPERTSFVSCDETFDEPLDMSTKRSHEAVSSSGATPVYSQQHRPSVITCASALLKAQCNLTDVAHSLCTAPLSDSNSSDSKETGNTNGGDSYPSVGPDKMRLGHRREVVSGSCDPVIDEHFRRSLGKDYQQIFSKSSSNSVSITVDDHFAKALGDTWHQLQQSKSVDAESSSSESPSTLQQAQQQNQFLQHSPEMVST